MEGLEQVAAGAPEASGGASAEQGPPPGRLEPGMEAGWGAPVGEGPQAVGPGPVAGVPAASGEEAGVPPAASGEEARKREGLLLDQCPPETHLCT